MNRVFARPDPATVRAVLYEPETRQCYNLAKLNLYQCLAVAGPRPALAGPFDELAEVEGDDAAESWAIALRRLLEQWV